MTNSAPPEALVIGSGPSGVAASWALLAGGARVCMVDGGVGLEADRAEAVAQLRSKRPDEWTKTELAAAQGNVVATSKGVEDKLLFGSDYPFRGGRRFHP